MENGMADRKNVEDLEFLEVEDIEEASENIVNSYTSTDNSNSERIHNAGIAKNVEKYTEEDDSLTQERKNTEQRRQASEKRTQAPRKRRRKKKSRIKNPVLRWVCRVLVTVVVTLAILCVGLYGVMAILTFGPSKTAKEQFVMSVQETSAIGFLANWFCSEEEIKQIKERNSVKDTDEVTDASLVNVDAAASNEDIPDIQVVDVKGATYRGKLMIVKDPSRLFVGTIDDFGNKQGTVVADIAARYNAVAGVNGGEFVDGETTYTGMPVGLVMVNGEVLNGDANTTYHVTGITFDNKLVVGNMTAAQAKEKNIRDCVSISNSIGPFLVINGEAQDVAGLGGGINPRTAVGQTADGSILLLAVDGRQANSLGASFSDLQDIMLQYGAVNASTMDGGTSTQMYYEGEVINTPYSPTGPRACPTAFLIK
jgi:exopolysaccharide biosynthesis protein